MTTIQVPNNNIHQHYVTSNNNRTNWNQAGSRSSYSLPHPAYVQGNQRYQQNERPIQYSPSFQDIPNQNANGNLYQNRQRPVSMYEMTGSSFNVNTKSLPPKPNQKAMPRAGTISQRQGDLVRSWLVKMSKKWSRLQYPIIKWSENIFPLNMPLLRS